MRQGDFPHKVLSILLSLFFITVFISIRDSLTTNSFVTTHQILSIIFRDELNTHLQRNHDRDEEWSCPKCSHAYTLSSWTDHRKLLESHMYLHHFEGHFQCVDRKQV